MVIVRRVAVFGRGGAGKSVFARRLGELTGLPVVELDTLFWRPGIAGLAGTPPAEWIALQRELTRRDAWIMDGDLGPYDEGVEIRLGAADTVVVLDFSFARCAWRAIRRGRERADFWRWVWGYRRRSLPVLRRALARHAPDAAVHVLRSPRAVRRFLAG